MFLAALVLTLAPAPLPAPSEEGRLDVRGVSLAYARWGPKDGVPVVLLHGGGGTFAHWAGQLPSLAKMRPVIAFDTRGHGRSTRGTEPFHYATLAEDVDAALEALHVPSAHVVGWSDGGIIALELALSHAARVRSLVLFGVNFDASGGQKGTSASVEAYWKRCRQDTKDFDGLLALLRPMWRAEPRLTTAQLTTLTAPTLVILAEKDELIRAAHVKALAKAIPNATLVTLEKAGHIAPWEAPQPFADAVSNFLARLP
jgi:pimeloyl-ACP methyl ester carboxylesterase